MRTIVEVQAEEGEYEAKSLDFGHWLPKPDDGKDNDKHALDQASNRIRHGRDHGQQDKGYNVLAKVKCAVEQKLERQPSVVEGFGMV